jgi:TolA-binding protein
MDPGIAVSLVFISLGLIGAGITRMFFAYDERKLKIRTLGQNPVGVDSLKSEIDAVRQEVARLRDTSTQYDISIQHTLEDMQQRLERLESRRPVVAQEPEEQKVVARGS